MDPLNRKVIADALLSSLKESNSQYIAITPSHIPFEGSGVHVITVQSIEGEPIIRVS